MTVGRKLPELHDRVRYTAKFLKSTGMFLEGHGAFREGVVTGDHEVNEWVTVLWDDQDHSGAVRHDVLIALGTPDYTG